MKPRLTTRGGRLLYLRQSAQTPTGLKSQLDESSVAGQLVKEPSGKQVEQSLYYFEGILLKAKVSAALDVADEEDKKDSFGTSNGTEYVSNLSRSVSASTSLYEREVEGRLMPAEGTKDGWK